MTGTGPRVRWSRLTLGTLLVSSVLAAGCGGSGGGDATPATSGSASAPAALTQPGATEAGFHAWWTNGENYLYRQSPNSTDKEGVIPLGAAGGDVGSGQYSVSRQGDLFIELHWRISSESTSIIEYSFKKVREASDAGSLFTTLPREHFAFIPGLIVYQNLSHNGRYVAAKWAANNWDRIGRKFKLLVVDLWAPGGATHAAFELPNPDTQIVGLNWISDTRFVLQTLDRKLYLFDASNNTYVDMRVAPTQFNGYQIVGLNFSPDGLQVAGLMTKDGTHNEAFVAESDYTNMRQLTNANLVLGSVTWMNTGLLQLSNLEMQSGGGIYGFAYVTDCRNYLVPTTASMLTQAQVEAAKPANLPCQFQASQ